MSRTFIFLTLLFVTSYCIEKNTNNVNQIIDELVELNKVNKAHAPNIGRTISQIRSAVHDSAKAFGAFYSKVEANCHNGRRYLTSFTAKLKGDLVAAQSGINSAHGRIKRSTASAARLTHKLKHAKDALKKSQKRQRHEAHVFHQHLLEAEDKLVVIRHIRNIVVDELLNGKAPASLIQVNTINTQLNQLKTLVEKDNDALFSSVVATLIEMSNERNLNDQKVLRNFLGALRKLRLRITEWRAGAIKDRKRLSDINKKSNAARLKSIRAVGRLLVEARSSVVAAQRTIDDLNNAVVLVNRGLKRKARESHHWDRLCADQKRVAGVFNGSYQTLRRKVRAVAAALLK